MIINFVPFDTGLCSDAYNINCKIILAGDPLQLDASVTSAIATKFGFKTSYMERLMTEPCYTRNAVTGKYNAKCITQLVKNYRSHEAILDIPNTRFYDGKLECEATAGIKT